MKIEWYQIIMQNDLTYFNWILVQCITYELTYHPFKQLGSSENLKSYLLLIMNNFP